MKRAWLLVLATVLFAACAESTEPNGGTEGSGATGNTSGQGAVGGGGTTGGIGGAGATGGGGTAGSGTGGGGTGGTGTGGTGTGGVAGAGGTGGAGGSSGGAGGSGGALPLGDPCLDDADCESGFCVDNVCCDSACLTLCNACTASKKGSGADGTCGEIAVGLDPDSECTGPLVCDGASLCKSPLGAACLLGSECIGGFCVDDVCCATACSGTCQACSAAKKGSGSSGVCGPIGVGLDPDGECVGMPTCNGAGACALSPNGMACGVGGECTSGFCVDGVCCNTSCNALCSACTAAKKGSGSDGTCGAISTGLDPDDECAGAAVCNGATVCRLPNGEPCLLGTECVSAQCVDGVCCNTSCAGTCQACTAMKKGSGADGVCGNVSAGLDPDAECFGAAACNGSGACALSPNGMACGVAGECMSGFCVDGVCCNTLCNTLCNACTAVKKGSGADGSCGVIAAGLDPDNDCPGTQVCNGLSQCKLPIGEACVLAADCVSSQCADGVCCDTSCTGICQACTAAQKGSGADGACGNIAAGLDPDNECAGSTSCNGSGACSLRPNGAACSQNGECSSGFCVDGVCCNTLCNTLCNACTAVKKGSGTDGTCGVIAAGLDPDNECSGTQVCNGASLCKLPIGEACVLATDCVSSQCVDGVCCNTSCTGICQACTAAKKGSGADGACGSIALGTDPDNECAGAISCNGAGACALFPNGAACSVNAECTSNFCVDGVCCNTVCNTLCNACTAVKKGSGTDGTCGVIGAGLDPDNECSGTQVCNGASLCKLPNGEACLLGSDCVSAQCADGVCCNASCTGICQACTAAKKGSGADGACGSIALGTDPDNECFGVISCNGAGACALLSNGTACTQNGECSSNFCIDGVCCNTVCNTLCNACTAIKKGSGTDGTCGVVIAGSDPDNECAGNLVCNGASLCKVPTGDACLLGSDCVTGFCVDGVCCNTSCTGTCQACTTAKKGSGADGVCGNIAVATDPDNECAGPISCNGAGACALLANGSPCSVNGECLSTFCVDGVCCNTSCTTLCNACTAAKKNSGSDGTCGVIAANTDPDGECPGATLCSGASSCTLFANGIACSINGECSSGNCADGVCCNTACTGTCQACTTAKKGSGANGTCGGVATGTDPDAECPGATTCNAVQMCGFFANGFACTLNAECASNFCVDGVCCNALCNGLCEACIGVLTSVSDGTCADVIVGTDPENECNSPTPNCAGANMCGP